MLSVQSKPHPLAPHCTPKWKVLLKTLLASESVGCFYRMLMWVTAYIYICYCPHGRSVTLRFGAGCCHSKYWHCKPFLVFPQIIQFINCIEFKFLMPLRPYYVYVHGLYIVCCLYFVNIGFKNAISKMFYLPLCRLSNNMKLLNVHA